MRCEKSLLRRISDGAYERGGSSATFDDDALRADVERSVSRILRSYRGMSPVAPDYGMPAPTDLGFGANGLSRIQVLIRDTLMKFEPRLQHIRVRAYEPNPGRPVVQICIDGEIAVEGRRLPIAVDAPLGFAVDSPSSENF